MASPFHEITFTLPRTAESEDDESSAEEQVHARVRSTAPESTKLYPALGGALGLGLSEALVSQRPPLPPPDQFKSPDKYRRALRRRAMVRGVAGAGNIGLGVLGGSLLARAAPRERHVEQISGAASEREILDAQLVYEGRMSPYAYMAMHGAMPESLQVRKGGRE